MHPSDDELSAYLNQDLADLAARQRLEAHLESCADCRERLTELRAVVRLLRGLENPVPTRSFRLDPSHVPTRLPEPEPLRIDPWIVRVQPALRRLTAIAAVLLVMLVTADVLTHRDSSENGTREVSALSSASQANSSTDVTSAGSSEFAAQSTPAAAVVPPATAASGGETSSSGAAVAAATSASSGGQAVSTSVSAASAADAVKSGEATAASTSAAAVALQQTEASGQPPSSAAPAPSSSSHGGRSIWRLVELAVGVVVIWLLLLTIVLPRMLRQRRS
jgi:hypothetical protein